jgi:hypothetical protein
MSEWARDELISTEESLPRLWSETYLMSKMSSTETTQPAVRGCAEGESLGVK